MVVPRFVPKLKDNWRKKLKRPEALAIFSEGKFAVARVISGIKKQAVPIPQGIRCRKSRLKLTSVLLNAPKREVPAKIARPVVTIQRRSSLSANRPIRGEKITPSTPNEAVANRCFHRKP